jgi:PST family polysaccharide transporter
MFPALSRLQNEPDGLRSYFLKGYSLFLAVVLPITTACALFAKDIVGVLLGPQWGEAVPVFRFLAPTILALSIINPMSYLMTATGRAGRSLRIGLLIAPVVVLGCIVGLPHGPAGVAIGFSAAMFVLIVPVVQWATQGTLITLGDVLRMAIPPLASVLVGAVAAYLTARASAHLAPLVRLSIVTLVLFGVHAAVLLFGFRQKEFYADVLRATGLLRRQPANGGGGS